MPGASPPDVSTPILVTFFSINKNSSNFVLKSSVRASYV
jgi:hypothetical protein